MRIALLLFSVIILAGMELFTGSVSIALNDALSVLSGGETKDLAAKVIILESRLPRALTAILSGAGLALSGLLMQTLFRNPLAGPSVLGVSSGASLGVALFLLASGGIFTGLDGLAGNITIALAATLGAFAVLLIVLAVSIRLADNNTLLIFGIMLSFFTGAVVDALQFKSSNESLRSFVNWGMGSFAETNYIEIAILLIAVLLGLMLMMLVLNKLNLLLLGDDYASSMGVNTKTTKRLIISATGIMAGVITAFCGPVAFIGLAVPHLVRIWLKTADHRKLIIPVSLAGAALALLCDLIARTSELPLNTIASALGAPTVILIIFRLSVTKTII